jgi:site-specific DNA recombinase
MRAVVYTRVSTEEQAEKGYSLEMQAEACRARALSLGAGDILQFSDEGVSGSLLRRPGLDAALEAIRRQKADVFICAEPDRLSRKLVHQLLLTDEIEKNGCRIEFLTFDWDSGAEGRLFYAIKGALAEYERYKILERTRAGKIQKALRGELTHSPNAYGYTFDVSSDRLLVSEAEAAVVRHAFELAAWSALGPSEIASRLNSLGIPSPRGRVWSRTTVARMLRNRTYSGVLNLHRFDTAGKGQNRYRTGQEKVSVRERPEDQWIPVSVPALVDEATWQRAQASLEASRRRRPGLSRRRYALRGLVTCGLCGQTMHGSMATTRGVSRPYYVCTAKSPGMAGRPRCPQPYFPAVLLEEAVWDTVTALLLSPPSLEVLDVMPREECAGPCLQALRDSLDSAGVLDRETVIRSIVHSVTVERRDSITVRCYVPGLSLV